MNLVFYIDDPSAAYDRDFDPVAFGTTHWRYVAPVNANSGDDVWRKMNVVDGDELPAKLGVRSMSVGDVYIDNDQIAHVVLPIGWKHISDPQFISDLLYKRRSLQRGLRRNPTEDHPDDLKAALWLSAIVSIVGGAAFLISYFWPSIPTEHLFFRGTVFEMNKTNGIWTSTFAYGNMIFSVNGSSRDEAVARTQDQINLLATKAA